MLNKVKNFWKAHAAEIVQTLCFTVGSVALVSIIMFGRIASYIM